MLDISFSSEDKEEEEPESEQSSEAVLDHQPELASASFSNCPAVNHGHNSCETDDYKSFRDRVKAALAVDPVFEKLVDELMFN